MSFRVTTVAMFSLGYANSSGHPDNPPPEAVRLITQFLGWTYTIAWTLSFYPQVYFNWKRKSVVGLSFDFVSYDVAGFLFYSFFAVGLYWIPSIKSVYESNNPNGKLPVQLNDIFFTLHALLMTTIMAVQCCTLERGNQKVSEWARVILAACFSLFVTTLVLSITETWTWLDYLYTFSYAKVAVTLLKYIPQVHLNYTRKSTRGWCIMNVMLDFTGGSACLLQLLVEAGSGVWPRREDFSWANNFGHIAKLCMSVITLAFDTIFLVQHFILYADREPYTALAPPTADKSRYPVPLWCRRSVSTNTPTETRERAPLCVNCQHSLEAGYTRKNSDDPDDGGEASVASEERHQRNYGALVINSTTDDV